MYDINGAIANNIKTFLNDKGKTETDLTSVLAVSDDKLKKILRGERGLNAVEIQKTADFLGVSLHDLTQLLEVENEPDPIQQMMDSFTAEAAKRAIRDADKIANMIIFHARVRANTEKMMMPWRG